MERFEADIKKQIDAIKAPEELIQKTMLLMHEENEKVLHHQNEVTADLDYPELDKHYKRRKTPFMTRYFGAVLAFGLAAAVFLFFNLNSRTIVWQHVDLDEEAYFRPYGDTSEQVIGIEEFENKTGIPVLPYLTVEGYSNHECIDDDGSYETKIYYGSDEGYILIISPEEDQKLDHSHYKKIGGREVSFGKDEQDGVLVADWIEKDASFRLYGFSDEKKLLSFLKTILAVQDKLQ